jgi:hypothetical protein
MTVRSVFLLTIDWCGGVGATSESGNGSNTLREVVAKHGPTSECNMDSAYTVYGGDVHDASVVCGSKKKGMAHS